MTSRYLRISAAMLLAATLSAPVAADEVSFNASMWLPPAHPFTKYGYAGWLEQLKAVSGGSLKPTLFTGSALLSPVDHLSGVRDGIAQVGWIVGSYTPSNLPEDATLFNLSFIYTDYFVGAFAMTEMNMTDPQLLEQWRRNGLVFGAGFSTPPYRMICTSEIATLDAVKGKKLRSGGGPLAEWAKLVEAVPVNVSSSETFTGLEKGQLDCATNAADDLRSRSYWDVAKHVTMVELGVFWSGAMYGINQDFWGDLDVEQRRAMLDTMAEAVVDLGIGYAVDVAEIVAEAKQKGVTFHDPDQAMLQSIENFKAQVPEYAVKTGDTFGIEDPAGLVSRFQAAAQKWEGLLEGVDRSDKAALLALLRREVYDRIDPATYGLD